MILAKLGVFSMAARKQLQVAKDDGDSKLDRGKSVVRAKSTAIKMGDIPRLVAIQLQHATSFVRYAHGR